MTTSPVGKILLIDDDADDCMVFKMALTEVDSSLQFYYNNSCDNIAALVADVKPDLIFLDINLPRINGIECLDEMQQTGVVFAAPIIIFSSSELPKDLSTSYEKGAALYFRKPNNITLLVESLREIIQMNWNKPNDITKQYHREGKYYTY